MPVKASIAAEQFLRQNNVEIFYQTPFKETTAQELGFEHVINCAGQTYNTDFMKQNFSSCLSKNGQIFVNDLMQLSKVDPRINPVAPAVKENIFCLGDITQTSLNECKGILGLLFMSEFLYKNLVQNALGRRPSHQLPSSINLMCLISLGPNYGIMVMNEMVKADNELGKMKFEMTEMQAKIRSGDFAAMAANDKRIKDIFGFLGCVNCCCCCCPCSTCFTPYKKSKMRIRQ